MTRPLFWLFLPAGVLAGLVSLLLLTRPLQTLTAFAPPVEKLGVENVRLSPDLITLAVRADGSEPVRIAQVQVDGGYRQFRVDPPGAIGRLDTVRIAIPYPWIDGESHKIALLTGTGAIFEHTIDVAQETPRWDAPTLLTLGLVGLLLGFAPVATGLLAYPALRRLGPGAIRFVLALTAGLLAYLLIDTLNEGLEQAEKAIDRLRAGTVVWVVALITAGLLLAVGRRGGRAPEGLALAGFMALGIGIHNFGEGLVVGAAFSAGEAALATFLVIGFTIHNASEGLGIATPLIGREPSLVTFAGLAALAGLPAIAGVCLGAQAVSPFWTAVCFGIGAGAIVQVIIELIGLIMRRGMLTDAASLGGVASGLALMYLTALFV